MPSTDAPAPDCIRDIPLPAFVLTEQGSTVYENPAYVARFGSREGQAAQELAIALRRGPESHIRAAMAGASRVVPLGSIGGALLDAHYFPIRDAKGAAAFVGVILVESSRGIGLSLETQVDASSGGAASIEQSLRSILDGMPALVWTATPDGAGVFYNSRWDEYTGTDIDPLLGGGWNDQLHPDDQQRSWDRWMRSLETGEAYEIEYRYYRRLSGEYRWFLSRR
jgi:PAS domain S-box-containing protein